MKFHNSTFVYVYLFEDYLDIDDGPTHRRYFCADRKYEAKNKAAME